MIVALRKVRGEWQVKIPVRQKTGPGREQELIALCPLMINQAWEVVCQGGFPASLLYVLIVSRAVCTDVLHFLARVVVLACRSSYSGGRPGSSRQC